MYNGVVTFPSTFFALRSEKVAQKAQYDCKLIPCPRELSSSCAVSLAFDAAEVEGIAEIIDKNRVKFEAIYLYQNGSIDSHGNGNGDGNDNGEQEEKEIIIWAE